MFHDCFKELQQFCRDQLIMTDFKSSHIASISTDCLHASVCSFHPLLQFLLRSLVLCSIIFCILSQSFLASFENGK